MNATASRYHDHRTYDDDDLLSEEEEEERRLSEEHGEAADADEPAATKRKRNAQQQNTTLTEEDAAAAKEFEEKMRRKKARPALTPVELKSDKGLIYVRRHFPAAIKKFREVPLANKARGTGVKSNKLAQRWNTAAQINAAGQYSTSLMGAYRDFARDLFPSLAPEDVFLKIEDLGKKKEVKDYLELMRTEFRREYMEGIYGLEKTDRILNELQFGMRAANLPMFEKKKMKILGDGPEVMARMALAEMEAAEEDEYMGAPQAESAAAARVSPTPKKPAVNPYAKRAEENEKDEAENVADDTAAAEDEPMTETQSEEKRTDADEEDDEATFSVGGEVGELNESSSSDGKEVPVAAEDEPMTETHSEDKSDEATFSVSEEVKENNVASSGDGNEQPAAAEPVVNEHDEGNAEKGLEDIASEKKTSGPCATEMSLDGVEKDANGNGVETADVELPLPKDDEAEPLGSEESVMTSEDAVEKEATAEEAKAEIEGESHNDNTSQETIAEEAIALDNNETLPTQGVDDAKTQETLTLVESQMDDVAMEYTQEEDERFSQVSVNKNDSNNDGGGMEKTEEEEDERFSQTQDDRFSQFTQGTAVEGPVFEEEENEGGDDNASGRGDGRTSDALGQTMDTQLSMEY